MKTIALIRTSTVQQEIESQKKEILEMIKSDGISVENIIIVGSSGASAIKQDELYQKNIQEVFSLIERGNISSVYVWSVDRIGRREETLIQFKNFLIEHKVQLIIKNPSLRLLNNDGSVNAGIEIAFSLFSVMAKQEMEQKKARFKRAKLRNTEHGKFNGGIVHFGYKVDADGKIIIDEEESEIVRLIFSLYSSGKYSIRTLANELNERGITHRGQSMKPPFIKDMFRSTAFIGYNAYNGRTREYPKIITEDLYNKVKEILKKNCTGISKRHKRWCLCTKLLICPQCGGYYYADHDYYVCSAYTRHVRGIECDNKSTVNIKWLDTIVLYYAKTMHLNYIINQTDEDVRQRQEQISINQNKIEKLKTDIEKNGQKKRRIAELYVDGEITKEEQKKLSEGLKRAIEEAERKIAEYQENNSFLQNSIKENGGGTLYHLGMFGHGGIYDNPKENYDIVHRYIKKITSERDGKRIDAFLETIYAKTIHAVIFPKSHKHKIFECDNSGELQPIYASPELIIPTTIFTDRLEKNNK